MSDDERSLLAAVCADPDADLPRLVYADWLDERSWPERAEFIRLQVAGVSQPAVAHLADQFGPSWRAELPAAGGLLRWDDFRRGFPEHVRADLTGSDPADLLAVLAEGMAVVPVRRLAARIGSMAALDRLLAFPGLLRLDTLLLIDGVAVHATDGRERSRVTAGTARELLCRLAAHDWLEKPDTVALRGWNTYGWTRADLARLVRRPGPRFRLNTPTSVVGQWADFLTNATGRLVFR